MKKLVFANLLLNLYLLAIVQPALPVIEYVLRYQYIVNELCENRDKPILSCNGKCYLGDQVEKQLQLEDHGKDRVLPPKMELEKQQLVQPRVIYSVLKREEPRRERPEFKRFLINSDHVTFLLRPPIA